jgi:hypothetical protein
VSIFFTYKVNRMLATKVPTGLAAPAVGGPSRSRLDFFQKIGGPGLVERIY